MTDTTERLKLLMRYIRDRPLVRRSLAVIVMSLPLLLWFALRAEITISSEGASMYAGTSAGSVVEPTNGSNSITAESDNIADHAVDDSDFLRRFKQAGEYVAQGEKQAAMDSLEQLILERPTQVELYLNLASLHAADGQLELARIVLGRGLKADKNYAELFNRLQKVHGVLAANAYNAALNETGNVTSKLDLPLVDIIELQPLQEATAEPAQDVDELHVSSEAYEADQVTLPLQSADKLTVFVPDPEIRSSASAELAEVQTILDEIR